MHTLLLVDDVQTTLAVEKAFLEARDLKVFVTTSPHTALKLAASVRPDLIVLDYEMPEMKGDEVCRHLRDEPSTSQIPVLIVSAHDDEMITKSCKENGAVGFVRKSDGREALLTSIAEVLGLPERRHVRVPCCLTVGIHSGGRLLQGLAQNVSAGGLYLKVNQELSSGVALRMSFRLPGTDLPIEVLGEVVRSETLSDSLYGYGIQLLEANRESIAALKEFVKKTV